ASFAKIVAILKNAKVITIAKIGPINLISSFVGGLNNGAITPAANQATAELVKNST
ncbi:MAG: hypothetical protein UV54_C0043G0017, partial [Candidatus Beckwithbacteria bacterium GW2011_GWA2_43_10]